MLKYLRYLPTVLTWITVVILVIWIIWIYIEIDERLANEAQNNGKADANLSQRIETLEKDLETLRQQIPQKTP